MAQTDVIILDDEEGQQVGFQVKAILERGKNYQVSLLGRVASNAPDAVRTVPQLVIPVLPPAKDSEAKLLSALRSLWADIPLLPVVRSEEVRAFESPLLAGHDF